MIFTIAKQDTLRIRIIVTVVASFAVGVALLL